MTTPKYTQEQIKDITDREAKALELLKELQLTPAASVSKVNMGNDTFSDKVVCYLQDIKYVPKDETFVEHAEPQQDASDTN